MLVYYLIKHIYAILRLIFETDDPSIRKEKFPRTWYFNTIFFSCNYINNAYTYFISTLVFFTIISMYRIVSNFFRNSGQQFFPSNWKWNVYQIKFAYTFRIHEGFNFLVLLRNIHTGPAHIPDGTNRLFICLLRLFIYLNSCSFTFPDRFVAMWRLSHGTC